MTQNSGDFTNLNQAENAEHWVKLMRVMPELFPIIPNIRERMLAWVTEKPATHILDGGCGPGDESRHIAAHINNEATQITGMDFSEAMIAYAKSQNNPSNITFQTGNLTHLPFEDNQFDAVRVERVLHHVPEAEKAFAEIYRILKPGGRFVIHEPDFTLTRLFPLPIELSHEYGQRYSDTNANGDIGSRLHVMAQDAGFTIRQHQADLCIGKDFHRMNSTFQAIELLRDLLAEKQQPDLMHAVEKAAENGTFYWAPTLFLVMAEKPS